MLETHIEIKDFKHLKIEYYDERYVVTLVDPQGYPVLKGYGNSIVMAINDLHASLI